MPAVHDELGDTVTVHVPQPCHFVAREFRVGEQVGLPLLAETQPFLAGILVPVDGRRHERACDDVGPPGTIDVVGVLTVVLGVVAAKLADGANGMGSEVGSRVPVSTGGDIRATVSIVVGDGGALVGVDGQSFDGETELFRVQNARRHRDENQNEDLEMPVKRIHEVVFWVFICPGRGNSDSGRGRQIPPGVAD